MGLFRELLPSASRVVVLFNPENVSKPPEAARTVELAKELGLDARLMSSAVRNSTAFVGRSQRPQQGMAQADGRREAEISFHPSRSESRWGAVAAYLPLTERIAHLDEAGDCCTAGVQSRL
jgi:hypothetical protein